MLILPEDVKDFFSYKGHRFFNNKERKEVWTDYDEFFDGYDKEDFLKFLKKKFGISEVDISIDEDDIIHFNY